MAFRELVQGIHSGSIPTKRSDSRNGPVLQVEEPVLITYEKPKERVLFNQARDCNPFMHLYEALWMLAGRNDVAPLAYYAKQFREYSDDGETLNGAYGYRWRRARNVEYYPDNPKGVWFGEPAAVWPVDQLKILIDHLRDKPDSRRAVLQMWSVEDDLLKIDSSKDVCCLAWDTKFRSPEGDTNIQELSKRFQNNSGYKFPVYAVDTQTGDQRLTWMTNAWKTGTRPTIEIEFDDSSTVRLTGEHVVYRKKKLFEGKRCVGVSVEECRVSELRVGDRLLSELSKTSGCRIWPGKVCKKNRTQYRVFKRNLYRNTAGSNMVKEHREYVSMFEGLLPKHSVHHRNGSGLDNRRSNLEQLPNKIHFGMDKMGENNPHSKMSKEDRLSRAKVLKDTWKNMPPEVRSAKGTYKKYRTEEQWKIISEYESSKSNHKIVAIRDGGVTGVYDFTVPGRHNAVLENGVLVHNCNLSVMFSLRDNPVYTHGGPNGRLLDMTVTNRSNDMIWGALGANAVHFSFLQEYVAAQLDVEVGVYNHFTNNMHVYINNWKPEEWLNWNPAADVMCVAGKASIPLVKDPAVFDRELPMFVDQAWDDRHLNLLWEEPFFQHVAFPIRMAFAGYKQRDFSMALGFCELIKADDWRTVATNWIEKRKEKPRK